MVLGVDCGWNLVVETKFVGALLEIFLRSL